MCGINGFNFKDEDLMIRMNQKVKHRGPDDDGYLVDHNLSLGHTRLSIIDLSSAAHQPMYNADKTIAIVFNGEIYNFEDIRHELKQRGHVFQSASDTEVIIKAYEADGLDCLNYFNGIFAFALWDKRKQRLFMARDRLGVKPLYYYWDGSRLIFSSEIKAILEHPIKRTLNLDALNIYLRMLYVPAPLTMFQGIAKLEPASYLVYRGGEVTIRKYWTPAAVPALNSRAEAEERIRTLLKDSVRLQLISDRPVGVFLSGGVDSTIITGLVAEQTNHSLKTFSVGYDVNPEKFNADFNLARQTSQYYCTDHHELIVTGADCARHLSEVIYQMDEPVANATEVSTYLLSRLAKEQVAVVLGGDGGDELFGGYERYRYSQLISTYQKIPAVVRRWLFAPLVSGLQASWPGLKKFDCPPGVARYLGFMAQKEVDIQKILRQDYNNQLVTADFYGRHYFSQVFSDPEQELMWADIQSWLPDESLFRSDKMSMAFGLEQRVPILDHRLVELSLQIPTAYKIHWGDKKAIFKRALRQYLPAHVLKQPKRGWFSPSSNWLRHGLRELAYEVFSPSYNEAASAWFDFEAIRRMLDRHMEQQEYQLNLLWALLTWQIWYHHFLNKN